MRRTLSLLKEYRQDDLALEGAPEHRIAQVGRMFEWMDNELSQVKSNSVDQKLEETMISADFTYAIMSFVQRQMFGPYSETGFAFEPLVKPDQSPNYLPVSRYQRRAGLDNLEYTPPKTPARPGSVVDATPKQWQPHMFKKQFDFDRQTLINDDLAYFQDQAQEMGRAARRTLEMHVSNFLWNAVTTARLVALGALYSTNGRLTTARISTARMAFNQRVDDRAVPIRARLAYIVHHAGLVDTVATIQASQLVPELATNAANVVKSTFIPIEDPYVAGTAPNLPWFAVSDWRMNGIIPFLLGRRAGMPEPIIVRKTSDVESITSISGPGSPMGPMMGDFATGNVVVMVWDEFGTYIDETEGNMFDYRGCYYSTGTAP